MISQNITSETRAIRAEWKKEMINELKYIGQYFEYYFENDNEKIFINKHFNIEYIDNNIICYNINYKELRKLKLISLNDDKIHFLIDKILKNSIRTDISKIIERRLSIEMSKEIDKEIIKSIKKYYLNK